MLFIIALADTHTHTHTHTRARTHTFQVYSPRSFQCNKMAVPIQHKSGLSCVCVCVSGASVVPQRTWSGSKLSALPQCISATQKATAESFQLTSFLLTPPESSSRVGTHLVLVNVLNHDVFFLVHSIYVKGLCVHVWRGTNISSICFLVTWIFTTMESSRLR